MIQEEQTEKLKRATKPRKFLRRLGWAVVAVIIATILYFVFR